LGSVALTGTQSVCPTQDTTYTLTATNKNGSTSANQTVTVTSAAKPTIVTFTATPSSINAGQTSTLAWTVQNATSVQITSLGTVNLTGSQGVSPAQTTTYTLTATNASGQTTQTVTVTVNSGTVTNPTLSGCAVSPTGSVVAGTPVSLNYTTTNATAVTISGLGAVALAGPVSVTPLVTTSYTITASGGAGTQPATCSLTVTVTAPQPPTAVIPGGSIETFNRQVPIDGSGSSDPQGQQLTYIWESLNTGMAIMDQGKPVTRVILGGTFGDYTIKLTVRNQSGLTSPPAYFTIHFRSTTIF